MSTQPTVTDLEWTELDRRAVDTARVLAIDAVQRVGNGHPCTAMSLAPAAYLLFQKLMRHDPADPDWVARDRFVLSPGHTSLTLYTQLFLSGYGLELEDLKAFRTAGSKTPGHPEYGHTAGVETTTGPLGQGIANAVGMAMAARYSEAASIPPGRARDGRYPSSEVPTAQGSCCRSERSRCTTWLGARAATPEDCAHWPGCRHRRERAHCR
jgi:transketolase